MIPKIILCFTLLFGLQNQSNLANPWIEYSSIEDASKQFSFSLSSIPNEIEHESISYIGYLKNEKIWQVSYGENVFVLRKGKGKKDISGDYNDYALKKTKKIHHCKITIKARNYNKSKDAYNLAIWHDQKYAYSIYSENGMNLDTIRYLLNQMSK